MTGTADTVAASTALQSVAERHLWRHFAAVGHDGDLPIFVRGDGCYLWDEHGRRHLDALSSLSASTRGMVAASSATPPPVRRASSATRRPGIQHTRAIELAARVAQLAPGDLNRVFFTSSGSEAVESALKLSRSYPRTRGEGGRVKVIARAGLSRHNVRGAERPRAALGADPVRANDAGG